MIAWDAGTPITTTSVITPSASIVRVVLDALPADLSHSADIPPRYRWMGWLGWTDGSSQSRGQSLIYQSQTLDADLDDYDGLYVTLAARLSGTLYRGVIMSGDITIGASIFNSVAQTLATGVVTLLTFDSERQDPFGLHSASVNTGRITIATPGWYNLGAALAFVANATGQRRLQVNVNQTTPVVELSINANAVAAATTRMHASRVVYLNAGDYLEVYAMQDSGGNLDTVVAANYSPEFWAVRVG